MRHVPRVIWCAVVLLASGMMGCTHKSATAPQKPETVQGGPYIVVHH